MGRKKDRRPKNPTWNVHSYNPKLKMVYIYLETLYIYLETLSEFNDIDVYVTNTYKDVYEILELHHVPIVTATVEIEDEIMIQTNQTHSNAVTLKPGLETISLLHKVEETGEVEGIMIDPKVKIYTPSQKNLNEEVIRRTLEKNTTWVVSIYVPFSVAKISSVALIY